MIKDFSFDVYALPDPGASQYFFTPCIAMKFYILSEQLHKLLSISIHIGEAILARDFIVIVPFMSITRKKWIT